jgi:Flp/Fap pilin component
MTLLLRFLKDDRGATAIEYGLIAAASPLRLSPLCKLSEPTSTRPSRASRPLSNRIDS